MKSTHLLKISTIAALVSLAFPLVTNAKGRCGSIGDGPSALRVHVKGIKVSDVSNSASAAWNKIAAAVQKQYGGNVQIGMVTFTILVDNPIGLGTSMVPGTFPMDFSGQSSIQNEMLSNFTNNPPTQDPAPCEPEKNCCTECGASSAIRSPINVFNVGFLPHNQTQQILNTGRRIGAGKRRLFA
jgi:hypothetical protein